MFYEGRQKFRQSWKFLFILWIALFWLSKNAASQESVKVPDNWISESEQLDQLLADIDRAEDVFEKKAAEIKEEIDSFRYQKRLAATGAERDYYTEMIRQTEAKLLLSEYKLYEELQSIAYGAKYTAGQLLITIETTDYGEAKAAERVSHIKSEKIASKEKLRNYEILKRNGNLTNNEQHILITAKEWQQRIYELWTRESKWYSQMLKRVKENRRHFEGAAQFIESILADLNGIIQNSARELSLIQSKATSERADALQRLSIQ